MIGSILPPKDHATDAIDEITDSANKSASGVYKSATKAITLTVMEGL